MTIGEKMDELQAEAEKLAALLQDRHVGLMIWNKMLNDRLRSMRTLVHDAIGSEDDPPAIKRQDNG